MKSTYQKICSQSGFRFRLKGKESLWYSEDHLLWVQQVGLVVPFSEEYRRIEYADIQGLSIHRPVKRWAFTFFYALTAILLMLIGFSSWFFDIVQEPWIAAGIASPSLIFLLLWIFRISQGKPVRCFLHTAAQTLPLKAVDRESHLQKFLAVVTPKIEQAQPKLGLEEILREIHQKKLLEKQAHLAQSRPPLYHGLFHRIGFALLFFEGLLTFIPFFHPTSWIIYPSLLLVIGSLIGLVIALSKSGSSYIPTSLQSLTKCALGSIFLVKYIGGTMLYISVIALNASKGHVSDPSELIDYFAKLSPWDNVPYLVFLVIDLCSSLLLSTLGFFATQSWYSKVRR